ncbi:MAG: PEP/pyruvate-binding domain-containing protein, partial [Bacteroidota bacterium]|nr:PEP/pyruvate-binding domain-containing protein [Bacteroidota bacterium]
IYKIIFKQSKAFMTEGMNEHQMTMRMRGRPKILLATNYEEAIQVYEKYKNNLLGIISDISYCRNGEMDNQAGLRLCEKVKSDDPTLTFLLQSSDSENEKIANDLGAGFLNKYSKTLSIELRDFIIQHFAFGDFIFRDPDTKAEITRAHDLQALQNKILDVPDKSLEYHIKRNHFSKWLNARALFTIAEMFKPVRPDDFNNLDEVRSYIFEAISNYRMNKGRGIIAKFSKEKFDEYFLFSRIGEGSIGGKARGLAFIDSLIKRNQIFDKYDDMIISIPRTVVLSTDIFDEFMEKNDLYKITTMELSDDEILKLFIGANLPFRIHEDLMAFLSVVRNPIAVRSSSLLEDSHYQPFAGIYSTYMIPKNNDIQMMLYQLGIAIKSVYASVFYKDSRAYMTATSNLIDEEKMGIVLQEICGSKYGNRFYPTFSGVARSINFYPVYPEHFEDGIATVALGLGKYIVDGGIALRFCPKYPKKILQLSSPDMALRDTQKYFYALDLNPDSFIPSTDEGINLLKLDISEAENDGTLKDISSTYDYENNIIRDGTGIKGKKLITFSNILSYNRIPLSDILQDLLEIGQKEMNNPVEIEFAVNMNTPKSYPKIFNFLQIRPIVNNGQNVDLNLEDIKEEDSIIISRSALGNGIINELQDIIYIKPESFNPSENINIALKIEELNNQFIKENRNYILVGPGRWGSADPWLGIPVTWPQISAARIIVESGLENYRIDPSQGTHFFQNLTSFRVGYFTINPYVKDGYYDLDYLSAKTPFYEDKFIKHIRFDNPAIVKINGRKNIGIILKPIS